jgi:hypothetical protein
MDVAVLPWFTENLTCTTTAKGMALCLMADQLGIAMAEGLTRG